MLHDRGGLWVLLEWIDRSNAAPTLLYCYTSQVVRGLKGDPTSHNMALDIYDKLGRSGSQTLPNSFQNAGENMNTEYLLTCLTGRWPLVLKAFDQSQADIASYSILMCSLMRRGGLSMSWYVFVECIASLPSSIITPVRTESFSALGRARVALLGKWSERE